MDTPKDPGLYLTGFMATTLSLIVLAWVMLPAHRLLDEEEAGGPSGKISVQPATQIEKAEAVLAHTDKMLGELETDKTVIEKKKEAAKEAVDKKKESGSEKEKASK